MEIFKAHQQWKDRPADERFESLEAMAAACGEYMANSGETEVPYAALRTEADQGEVKLVGKSGAPAGLTHWSFGQLASRVGAPAEYLRKLPATLAVQNLNHGLAHRQEENGEKDVAKLLFHTNHGLLLRALTSDKYTRIWNADVTARLLRLEAEHGWEAARPTFNVVKGMDWPSLYASDHDMFAFLLRPDRAVAEPGTDKPLYRGVIVENSEVGDSALRLTRFLFREMCGNHIIWGASKTAEISIRHVGRADQKWGLYAAELRRYADGAASLEEAAIARAKQKMIAGTKDEVLDKLFGVRSLRLSRKVLEAAYGAVVPEQDGDPKTAWGMVQGLTRLSQTQEPSYADRRTEIDRAAGRLMQIDF